MDALGSCLQTAGLSEENRKLVIILKPYCLQQYGGSGHSLANKNNILDDISAVSDRLNDSVCHKSFVEMFDRRP